MDEFGFIASLLRPLASNAPGALGLRDDAALVGVPAGYTLVITKDAISAGVHCIGDEPPALIARKLLRTNLSDISAMGAKPYGYFLALMLPDPVDDAWLRGFAEGLRFDQEHYGMALMGGDTTRTLSTLSLSATLLGLVPEGKALLRSGAKVGDAIYVSGMLGDAALGLRIAQNADAAGLDEHHRAYLLDRYRLPQPRTPLGQALQGIASACMDISDGLMQDLGHLCEASGVGARIQAGDVPLSEAVRTALVLAPSDSLLPLVGGDDYELLFTVPPTQENTLPMLEKQLPIRLTRIGRTVAAQEGVRVFNAKGDEIPLEHKGYQHLR